MQRGWSKEEVELIVDDYFSMLGSELRGEPYNKTEHRQALKLHLRNRSDSSIERKHQNISSVVIELGLPYISGYKPLRNYQRALLPDTVQGYLGTHLEAIDLLEKDADASPALPTIGDILRVLDTAPQGREQPRYDEVHERPQPQHSAFDYLRREAVNRRLGLAGEQLVVNFEKARLVHAGRESLSERVEHVAVTQGDAAGFDILSYEADGRDRFIEAKTTKHGKETPFYVTDHELRFSRDNRLQYWLYRVFDFGESPRLYHVPGSVDVCFRLRPLTYVASV